MHETLVAWKAWKNTESDEHFKNSVELKSLEAEFRNAFRNVS